MRMVTKTGFGAMMVLSVALVHCSSGGPLLEGVTGTATSGSGGETTGTGGSGGAPSGATSTSASSGTGGQNSACIELPAGAVNARDHLDSWGVVTSPKSASGIHDLAAQLDEIGVRRLRSHLADTTVKLWQALQDEMKSAHHARPTIKYDDLVIAYNSDPATWSGQKAAILAAAAAGLLTSIEGPNEMNNYSTGGGTHGVDDTTDKTMDWAGPEGNVVAWMKAIHTWKAGLTGADAAAMAKVEVFAPTIATGLHDDYAMLPDLSGLVDFGNMHYYSGNGLQPSLGFGMDNAGVGYFANIYRWCQAAMTPKKRLVVSEMGATTPPGQAYGPHAQAAYILNQLHEAAGIGARYVYLYTLVDPSTGSGGVEGNFGIFDTDGTEKPAAAALAALKHLFSLKNSYDDPANDSDTACVTPGYDATKLSVAGLDAGAFPSRVRDAVVYPKSDGTTVVSVTNESKLSNGQGGDISPAPVTATVHFGSAQTWHLYDVLGATPTKEVASGTGESVDVPLLGYPKYLTLDAPPGYHP